MKSVLIIGATSAIAQACARQWAGQGARLFLVARHAARLEAVAADLTARGAASVVVFTLDATALDRHPAMLAAVQSVLPVIDIALLAHGTLPDQAACEADGSLLAQAFNENAVSVMALLNLLAGHFCTQGHGTLAVITSVAGDRGRPSNYVYGAAKAAVSVFSEGLRARLFKSGVHLCDIRPGFVASPMTAGLSLPPALVVTPDAVAGRILKAIDTRRDVVYTPAFWILIMWVIRWIPGWVFKRLSL